MEYTTNNNTFVVLWYSEAAMVPSFMFDLRMQPISILKSLAIDLYQRHAVLASQIDQIMKEFGKVSYDMVTSN